MRKYAIVGSRILAVAYNILQVSGIWIEPIVNSIVVNNYDDDTEVVSVR